MLTNKNLKLVIEANHIINGEPTYKTIVPWLRKKCFKIVMKDMEILTEDNVEEVKERVKKVIKQHYLGIKNRTMINDVEDFGIRIVMKRHVDQYEGRPIHVRVANMLYDYIISKSDDKNLSKRTVVPEGSVIVYVHITPRSRSNVASVKPIEMVKPEDVNTIKYGDILLKVMKQVYEPLGLDNNDVMGIKQMKISDYT